MAMSEEAVQRLRAALEDLEHKRRNHNQRIWLHAPIGEHGIAKVTCGSSMCLAADVLINEGVYQFVVPPWTFDQLAPGAPYFLEYAILNEDLEWWRESIQPNPQPEDPDEVDIPRGEGNAQAFDRMRQIGDIAQELLDLDEDDAEDLFNADNSLEDMWALAWRFSDKRIPLPQRIINELSWEAVEYAAECVGRAE